MNYIEEIKEILEDDNIWGKDINKYYEKQKVIKGMVKDLFHRGSKKQKITINKKKIEKVKEKVKGKNDIDLSRMLEVSENMKKNESFEISTGLTLARIIISLVALMVAVLGQTIVDGLDITISLKFVRFVVAGLFLFFSSVYWSAQDNQYKSQAYNRGIMSIQIALKESLYGKARSERLEKESFDRQQEPERKENVFK